MPEMIGPMMYTKKRVVAGHMAIYCFGVSPDLRHGTVHVFSVAAGRPQRLRGFFVEPCKRVPRPFIQAELVVHLYHNQSPCSQAGTLFILVGALTDVHLNDVFVLETNMDQELLRRATVVMARCQ